MRHPKEKVITFIIDTKLDDQVEHYAKRKGMLKRAVIKTAIEAFFSKPVDDGK